MSPGVPSAANALTSSHPSWTPYWPALRNRSWSLCALLWPKRPPAPPLPASTQMPDPHPARWVYLRLIHMEAQVCNSLAWKGLQQDSSHLWSQTPRPPWTRFPRQGRWAPSIQEGSEKKREGRPCFLCLWSNMPTCGFRGRPGSLRVRLDLQAQRLQDTWESCQGGWAKSHPTCWFLKEPASGSIPTASLHLYHTVPPPHPSPAT